MKGREFGPCCVCMRYNNIKHARAPIFEALTKYYRSNPLPFHVPGHKMGQGFDNEGLEWFSPLIKLDATELTGLDDLHHAEGVIMEAQNLAAHLFRADHTYFLTGGSTAGNIAMIWATCQPEDTLIVQRNVHKSVINGLIMARGNPVFLNPQIDHQTGIATGVTPELVEEAIKNHPNARGVLITNPNYYGMGVNIKDLVMVAHQYNIPLLVDEAHGAHFGFHSELPISAMDAGADISVQSTHKMLPSMTMSSMLHVKGEMINQQKLSQALSMFQSSSPSYPLLASLDLARRYMAQKGHDRLNEVIRGANAAKNKIRTQLTRIHLSQTSDTSYFTQDPLKIILHADKVSGYQFQKLLEHHHCFPEMADDNHVILALSVGTTKSHLDNLLQILHQVEEQIDHEPHLRYVQKKGTTPLTENVNITKPDKSPSQVMQSETEIQNLEDSVGRICAEFVTPYPPGIPVLIPGERIDFARLQYIKSLKQAGAHFQGIHDKNLQQILVTVE